MSNWHKSPRFLRERTLQDFESACFSIAFRVIIRTDHGTYAPERCYCWSIPKSRSTVNTLTSSSGARARSKACFNRCFLLSPGNQHQDTAAQLVVSRERNGRPHISK